MRLGWALGALWLGLAWVWLAWHPALHSDALYLHDLLRSLQAGGRLGTWDLPPAPSLWPDLGLVWLCQRLSDDLIGAQRLFGLLLAGWLWSSLTQLLRRLWDLSQAGARAWAAAGLILGLLLAPADSGLMDWVLPAHHGVALCVSLSLWAWALKQREEPASLSNSAWKGLGLAFFVASDKVLWPWGILPLALLALRLRRPGQLRVASLILLAGLLAWGLEAWLAHTGARVASVRWGFVLQRSEADRLALWQQTPALLRTHAGLALAGLAALGLWAWPLGARHSGPRVLLLGWTLTALASLALATLLGSYNGRYLYLLLFLPATLLPVLAAERWHELERPVLLAIALGGLLWLAGPARRGVAPTPTVVTQAAALDQALQARGLRYGWADYWQARPLRLFSRQGTLAIPMISTGGTVEPYAWIGDRSLLGQGAALERPQFVVLNGLDEAAVRARAGAPSDRLEIEGLAVYFYRPLASGKERR